MNVVWIRLLLMLAVIFFFCTELAATDTFSFKLESPCDKLLPGLGLTLAVVQPIFRNCLY